MTVGYYTDNNVSHGVMRAFSDAGFETRHIEDFDNTQPAIFYGILRGSGMASRILKDRGIDFWYVDNGYFDAVYMDSAKFKDMHGKYRIVKNDYIEPLPANFDAHLSAIDLPMKFLMLPPSVYSAFMHDTTPEDWIIKWGQKIHNLGHSRERRDKEEKIPLDKQLAECDAVFAFNSMGVVRAMQFGKAVYTTHGIIRNYDLLSKAAPRYNVEDIKKFYEPKQFTLDEIRELGVKCLR